MPIHHETLQTETSNVVSRDNSSSPRDLTRQGTRQASAGATDGAAVRRPHLSGSGRPTRTFQQPTLETAFVRYCQMTHLPLNWQGTAAELLGLVKTAQEFISSPDFDRPAAPHRILGDQLLSTCRETEPSKPSGGSALDMPPHLSRMCEEQLLTAEQERQLFQRMNYLRFCAASLLQDQTPVSVTQWDLERVHGLWRAANWHRDCIIRSNTRLVISIVKKFTNPQCGFDDLFSDGIMALLRAVHKFDYRLGFRFSTYATQVVRRDAYRHVMDRQNERLKAGQCLTEQGIDIAEETGSSTMGEEHWNSLRSRLTSLLNELDKREKLIIRARFSLGGHRKVQTLQHLANKLGISKERVRQLEKRALSRLQTLAAHSTQSSSPSI
ncbi:sigma-70 family RNA polymerase sigma factor [Aureliella helgolandensis]|uniref:RNA polymerase sigma factor RpoD n=1 Tax=Aureliella helgolandensis TaxID=2527968 RepID=A0A518GCB6_9BACT|nr:sigma-70 family RNA polymerase sigma factor [Aureliella helgolandensis]QDV26241.1 RNA polymerase sigma factor RpoD [Aureliella helgolandensis]